MLSISPPCQRILGSCTFAIVPEPTPRSNDPREWAFDTPSATCYDLHASCPENAQLEASEVEDMLKIAVGFVVPLVEACGALVIIIEVIRTAGMYLLGLFRHTDAYNIETFRIRLGKSMVMGLEFQMAADISGQSSLIKAPQARSKPFQSIDSVPS